MKRSININNECEFDDLVEKIAHKVMPDLPWLDKTNGNFVKDQYKLAIREVLVDWVSEDFG